MFVNHEITFVQPLILVNSRSWLRLHSRH